MASVHKDLNNRRENFRTGANHSSKVPRSAGKYKQKWVSEHKQQYGSLQEGMGFAFKRKEKVKHEYNKLLRIQRKRKGQETNLTDKYPEHLQHLYLAEEERERNEELKKRQSRTEGRIASMGIEEEEEEKDSHELCPDEVRITTAADPAVSSEQTDTVSTPSPSAPTQLPDSKKKKRKMTSYNRTKEDYVKQQEERERKKEAYQKSAAERVEAIQKYKEKKIATYQLLKKKTKKGQPNLNAQMELLLEKIQGGKK
ncbi:thyroid transcription factor 1-associated protein 26 homolog [Clupea harengus]|uniref:Thyroid transcription factor 1-associated protein 26 homolog n=1 Tax=Clupea harengus TaxID=7950 RepID=A0A6P3VG23_CLUHA|nr:thyroid transcription factor 1-associated protein 26 homolog [Clupea harengus]